MNDNDTPVSSGLMAFVMNGLEDLSHKARFGLPGPVTGYREAHPGTVMHGKMVHLWVRICGNTLGLRISKHRSRPKRRCLRDLTERSEAPTILVYDQMKHATLVHKLAQCLKTGLSCVRRGLIYCLRFKRDNREIRPSDNRGVHESRRFINRAFSPLRC